MQLVWALRAQLVRSIGVETFAVIVATLGMLITALALWFTVSSFRKQLQLNFFADYTKRYQEIILHFPEFVNEQGFDIELLDDEVRNSTMRYMRAYFDLCSEEYYLWNKRHIDKDTWREWELGIKFAFSKPAFQQSWRIIRLDTKYYAAFSAFVNAAIDECHT